MTEQKRSQTTSRHEKNSVHSRSRRQKRRHQRKRRRLFLWCLLVLFIILGFRNFLEITGFSLPFHSTRGELSSYLDDLYSPQAVLADAGTGQVLGSRNENQRVYPASLTKIMTVLVGLEHIEDLNGTASVPADIYQDLYEEGASMAGFQPGESVTYRDLLYGALLPSGAECCLTLAKEIAGDEEAFASMMNEKADELGMSRTHFTNCTGLQNNRHYSTAGDIAKLLVYALKNPDFRQIFTTNTYTASPTASHPDGLTFVSTLSQSLPDPSVTGGKILGGKTGYTEDAGLCLASLASINGREYILVTTGAPGDHETEPYHVLDAIKVYGRIGAV